MPPVPQPAVVNQADMLEDVQRLLVVAPKLAFEKASLFENNLLRERVRRQAFLALAASDPKEAALLLPRVVEAKWLGALPFAQALDVAWHSVGPQPENSRRLLTASASRHPASALREVRQYIELSYGQAIWEAAALEAPDQVVALGGLAEGPLARTKIPELQALRSMETLTLPARQRHALAGGPPPESDAALFSLMVDRGRRGSMETVGSHFLLALRQGNAETVPIRPRDVVVLASLASTEEERETALQRMRKLSASATDMVAAGGSALRSALALVAENGPVAPLLSRDVLAAALGGIAEAEDPVAEAVRAATFITAAPGAAAEVLRGLPAGELHALLLARVDSSRPEAQFFPPASRLRLEELFPKGLCLQRYFFHNDDDGVESFQSFLASYESLPDWRVEKTRDMVRVISPNNAGRRIEIFANVPLDLQIAANAAATAEVNARMAVVTKAVDATAAKPVVLVHRGHDYHFEKTRPFLVPSARLVYLGSCRGMGSVEDVVTRSKQAQVIVTRGIGSKSVNDPFLKALNLRMLQDRESVDWESFWESLRPALAANEHFSAYVPPHRNEAAIFLGGWYRAATASRAATAANRTTSSAAAR